MSREPSLGQRGRNLLRRVVYRRALHIAKSTVKGPVDQTEYANLVKLDGAKPKDLAELRRIRQEIVDHANKNAQRGDRQLKIEDVWLDVPPSAKPSKDLLRCYVDTKEGQPILLRDLFPVDEWLAAYGEHKWTAHVFCSSDAGVPERVNQASLEILQNEFKLQFQPRATLECKL